jgi:hypothetical protein
MADTRRATPAGCGLLNLYSRTSGCSLVGMPIIAFTSATESRTGFHCLIRFNAIPAISMAVGSKPRSLKAHDNSKAPTAEFGRCQK